MAGADESVAANAPASLPTEKGAAMRTASVCDADRSLIIAPDDDLLAHPGLAEQCGTLDSSPAVDQIPTLREEGERTARSAASWQLAPCLGPLARSRVRPQDLHRLQLAEGRQGRLPPPRIETRASVSIGRVEPCWSKSPVTGSRTRVRATANGSRLTEPCSNIRRCLTRQPPTNIQPTTGRSPGHMTVAMGGRGTLAIDSASRFIR